MASVASEVSQMTQKSNESNLRNLQEQQQQLTHQKTNSSKSDVVKQMTKSIFINTIKTENKMIEQQNTPTSPPPSPQQKSNKIPLKLVNAHITCSICKGYLIDATTLVECLHSFCHSCIMKHLRVQDYCPKCEVLVNKAKLNIKPDTTLQAIVYKLVPELYEKELLRRRAFYKMCPEEAALAAPHQRGEDTENLIFSPKEALSLSLEFADMEELSKKSELKKIIYLQCPAIFQVSHLKKFVLSKFGIDGNQLSVELMYKVKTIVLPDHYTLMDIAYIYTWKRDVPMRFFFRVIKNLQPVVKSLPKKEEGDVTIPAKIVATSEVFDSQKKIKVESDEINCETNNNSVSDKKINANQNIKHESIKLKIELSKQGNMVSILKSGSTNNQCEENKKTKSEGESLKQKERPPKLLLLKSNSIKKSNASKEPLNKIKMKEITKKLLKNQTSNDNKKKKVKIDEPVKQTNEVSNKNQNNSNIATSVPDIDPKKSEFLNTFNLAPTKVVSTQKPLRLIAPKAPIPSLKPLSAYMGAMQKRKNKEPLKTSVNNNNATSNKKAKTNDLKHVLEKIIREKSNQNAVKDNKETISFNLAPFPIGSSKIESTPTSLPLLSSTIPSTSNTSITSTSPLQKSEIGNKTAMPVSTPPHTGSPSVKSISPVLNKNNNNEKNQLNNVSYNNKNTTNNISTKKISPKRSMSPNSSKNPEEPVFKKPMSVAKNPTPEKMKPPQTGTNKKQTPNVNKRPISNFPPIAPRNVPNTPPHKPSNYLNFALLNASKASDNIRMLKPPIYSPFSPVYAPNSPQYTPNFDIQSRSNFRYANPQAYAYLMDNLYKNNDLFNYKAPTTNTKNTNNDVSSVKTSPNNSLPRNSPKSNNKSAPSSPKTPTNEIKNINSIQKPKQQDNSSNSLLNKLNFPSSLSVTLTTDTDESRTNSPNNKTHSSVNNYIEIVKLPESPTNSNNNALGSKGTQSGKNNDTIPSGCISPPKTIIKIDDVKKIGETVHKDIINVVNEMCSTSSSTSGQNKNNKKTGDVDSTLNKENGTNSSVTPLIQKNINGKETFQTKFLESILPKLNEKVSKEEVSETVKTSPTTTKTYSKANPVVGNQSGPVYSKAVQNKLDELRKISPKPSQNKSKTSPLSFDQRPVQQLINSTPPQNYNKEYEPAKLANIFNDFERASQNSVQNVFSDMVPNTMTSFTPVPMLNFMQQAFLMDQWQKLQKMQKNSDQTYLENSLQNFLKQNNQQTSSNRIE